MFCRQGGHEPRVTAVGVVTVTQLPYHITLFCSVHFRDLISSLINLNYPHTKDITTFGYIQFIQHYGVDLIYNEASYKAAW